MKLPAKIIAIHYTLAQAGIPHAFGGALSLAWCTPMARGTVDIDLNLFVAVDLVDGFGLRSEENFQAAAHAGHDGGDLARGLHYFIIDEFGSGDDLIVGVVDGVADQGHLVPCGFRGFANQFL